MAKAKPSKRKPANGFKPGNKHGTKGGAKRRELPQYDVEALARIKIDNRMVVRYITVNSHLTEKQARRRMEDPEISIFEKRVLGSILGDDDALPFTEIINRVAGKNPERHIHEAATDKYRDWTDAELLAEAERLEKDNRQAIIHIEREKGMRPEQVKAYAESQKVIDVSETEPARDDSSTPRASNGNEEPPSGGQL